MGWINLLLLGAVFLIVCSGRKPDNHDQHVDQVNLPKGSYCGSYYQIAVVKVTIVDPQHTNLSAIVYSETVIDCPYENSVFNPNNGQIEFPSSTINTDCLNQQLTNYAIDPTDLALIYNDTSNTLTASVVSEGVSVILDSCPSEIMSGPSGTYCGNYNGMLIIRAKTILPSAFNITGSINGVNQTCANETYSIDSKGNMSLPYANKPSDCVGSLLSNYGLTGSELVINWSSSTNVISVDVPSVSVQFNLSPCTFFSDTK